MSWLRIHVNTGQATEEHFEQAAAQLVQQAFDAQTASGLRILADDAVAAPGTHPLPPAFVALVEYPDRNVGRTKSFRCSCVWRHTTKHACIF
ncbi:MAG: hypothetical protein U1E74_01250 [Paenacidovorax caeni]